MEKPVTPEDKLEKLIEILRGFKGDSPSEKSKTQPSINTEPIGEVGWMCPVCHRGLSPHIAICPCDRGHYPFRKLKN